MNSDTKVMNLRQKEITVFSAVRQDRKKLQEI